MEVTYLICNYNYGQWIEQAVESVLNQTIACNICVIDDASSDDSESKLLDLLKTEHVEQTIEWESHWSTTPQDKTGCVIFKNNNTGPSDARNAGFEEMLYCTDIFAILDADDWVEPTKTEKLLPYFENPSVGVVYADYHTLNTENDNLCRVYKESFDYERLLRECIVHSGAFIRKEALLAVKDEFGFYDKTMRVAEDWDLWLRIARQYMILHHPEALTTMRVTPHNSTNSVNQAIWQQCWQRIGQKLNATQPVLR